MHDCSFACAMNGAQAYEFWMRDANAAPPPPRGEWAVLSARAIAEHALDEHWNMIERFIPQ